MTKVQTLTLIALSTLTAGCNSDSHDINGSQKLVNELSSLIDIQSLIQITNRCEINSDAYVQLEALQASGKSKLQNTEFNEVQITDVIKFLPSLTDPCIMTKSGVQLWVSNSVEFDPDGTRLIAIDAHGQEI